MPVSTIAILAVCGYGIFRLLGDIDDFLRRRRDRCPSASVHDVAEARRSLRPPRSLP